MILNPSHPYTIDAVNNKASVIFADGVDYAIEVKPDLSSASEIHRALKQIRSIKQLLRKRTGMSPLGKIYEKAYRVPGIVFTDKTFNDYRKLIEHIVEYYEQERVPAIEQFDLIAINNDSLVLNLSAGSYLSKNNYRGIIYKKYNEETLMMFLLYLNKIPHSEMEIGPNVISLYITEPIK